MENRSSAQWLIICARARTIYQRRRCWNGYARARTRARQRAYTGLARSLSDEQRQTLSGLLIADERTGRTHLAWLREWPDAARINLLKVIERLDMIRGLGIEPDRERLIHQARYAAIGREAALLSAQHVSRLFTLNWISDPLLRRQSHAGLNKGEARNALARRVFNRLGELRDRTFENQRYRASASTWWWPLSSFGIPFICRAQSISSGPKGTTCPTNCWRTLRPLAGSTLA